MARSVAYSLRNGGRFSPVRVAYRTKYVYSNAHGASASPHACLRYTSETIAGATFAFALRDEGALTAFARSTAHRKEILIQKAESFPHGGNVWANKRFLRPSDMVR